MDNVGETNTKDVELTKTVYAKLRKKLRGNKDKAK